MEQIIVKRKPRKCPKCKGDVYEILFGEPICSEKEMFKRTGKHYIFYGCIISDNDPNWACSKCGQEFRKE